MDEKRLTAKDLKEIDEIHLDKQSVENTFKTAMYYHSNRVNELIKKERKWWDDLIERFGLDKTIPWTINRAGNYPTVCEKVDEN
jgi:hypothetical protein